MRRWLRVVLSGAAHLIPYALVADASPLGLAAAVTVMRTGRLKALGFGLGALAGQLLACAVLVVIGSAAVGNRTTAHPTLRALLEVALGIGLLVLAVVAQRRPEVGARPSAGRGRAALDRLGRVRTATAAAIGFLLGIGGPKRLVLSGLAAASIAASGGSGGRQAALVGWYGVLATAIVWVPVLAYVLLGTRAVDQVDAALEWLTRRSRPVTVYSLVAVGLLFVIGGLAEL